MKIGFHTDEFLAGKRSQNPETPPNMNDQKIPEKTFTRRDFLKTSSVAASAVAVGSLDVSRSAHAAGSDIIKVGMIGCGGRNAGAGVQALTADPGARLFAMCDIFKDRVQSKREE